MLTSEVSGMLKSSFSVVTLQRRINLNTFLGSAKKIALLNCRGFMDELSAWAIPYS
jgi:hypothetical protein